jgi:transposase
LNAKLHAVCDGNGRPLVMLLSEGQMSDDKGAALMLSAMPKARRLLADKGYDAAGFRAALAKRPSPPAFLPKPIAKPPSPMTPSSYKQRHKIENLFGRLKDWPRIHTRSDRCALPPSRQSASPQPSFSGCNQ